MTPDRHLLLSALLVCCALTLWVPAAFAQVLESFPPPDRPVPRTDENSIIAHRELLEKARTGRIDLYFEGDSIVRRWGASDYPNLLENWNQNFFGWNAANFGWAGDRTENILWRLDDGELDGVEPKVIVLLAGTNNIGNQALGARAPAVISGITRGIEAIIDRFAIDAPEATVILTGVFPRNDNPAATPAIRAINVNLSRLADGDRILYLDINDRLTDERGQLLDEVTSDGLHLSAAGYQVWADALRPILTGLLGPPASVDQAPPPTGNPAARDSNQ